MKRKKSYIVKRSQVVVMMRAITLEPMFKFRGRMRKDPRDRYSYPDFRSVMWMFEGDCRRFTRGPDVNPPINLASTDSYRVTGECKWIEDWRGDLHLWMGDKSEQEWRYAHDGIISVRTAEAMRLCRQWIRRVGGFSKALEILKGK